MNQKHENDRLGGLLRSWQVDPQRSTDFSAGVWRTIEERRAADSWSVFARAHPAALATVLLLATFAGGWGGAELARTRVQIQSSAMADAYVQSLDARQMTSP